MTAVTALALAGACTNPTPVERPVRVPAAPPEQTGSAGPNEPPHVWIAGILTDVTDSRIGLQEPSGQAVTMQRLAAGTTAFYRVSGGTWEKLAPQAQIAAGQTTCTETLIDGPNLVALRVFLGAGCGPA